MERKKKMKRRIGWIIILGIIALIVAYGYQAGWRIELTKIAKEPLMAGMEHKGHQPSGKHKNRQGYAMPEKITTEGDEGHIMSPEKPITETKRERKILYWQDPMHPSYTSNKPGKAPDCGMDLVPVYADEASVSEEMPPGTIMLNPVKQQLIGVKKGIVDYRSLSKTTRTVGVLQVDERKILHFHTKIEGWIEKLYVDYTGQQVRKNQPLVAIYSPELVSTQEEYLLAYKGKKYLNESPFEDISLGAESLLEATRRRLSLWDITDEQIRELEQTKKIKKSLILHSPITGFVLNKNAYEGLYVMPNMELYTIADLSNMWVYVDIYEYEIPMVKLGQESTITLSYYPGEAFQGKVTYIYPYLDPKTRTNKIRLEFSNPDFKLRPDMYVNAQIKLDLGNKLSVPEDAVLDSGAEQIVFLTKEGGHFVPQKVKLGAKVEGYYEVLSGLSQGDQVVTSANFLIDSESRLKAALGAMGHQH